MVKNYDSSSNSGRLLETRTCSLRSGAGRHLQKKHTRIPTGIFLLFVLLATLSGAFAQTTLISPTGDGGFETGSTFIANNWSTVNTSNSSRAWYIGTAQTGYSDTRAAFIGSSNTSVGTNTTSTVVHLYRSITIPPGATNISLTFKYKQAVSDYSSGNYYDYIVVSTNTSTPVAGTVPSTGIVYGPYPNANVTTFTTQTATLPNSLAGTTTNLIFTFKADGVSPHGYGAIDDVSLTYTPSVNPIISGGTLAAFGNVCQNTTASSTPSFTVSGANLTGDVTVNALNGYTYSTSSGGTYTTTLTLSPVSGSISTSVYVKFTPTSVASYNGNIVLSGGGATSANVAASGSGVNTSPSVSAGTAGSLTPTAATISGSTISSLGCSSITAYGIEYSTTSGFTGGTGTQVAGTGFSGSAGGTFSATISGLSNNTTYYYRAYATNNGGTSYSGISSFSTLIPGQIGTGTGTTATLPVYSYFGYNYTQQIYLASEINAINTPGNTYITKIRFKPVSVLTPQSSYNNWDIYIGNTSKTSFTGTADWVASSGLTQVFSGTIQTLANNTWVDLTLTTPFLWDGTSNLVIAIDENSSGYVNNSTGTTWASYTASASRGIYTEDDTTNFSPASPGTADGTTSTLPQIQLVTTTPPDCAIPTAISGAATAYNTGTATWAAPASGSTPTGYQWELRTGGAAGSGLTGLTETGTTATPGTISYTVALTGNTSYTLYVRANCGGSYGGWGNSAAFTTPCTPLSTFPYTEGFESISAAGTLPTCMAATPTISTSGKTRTYIASDTSTNSALTPRTGSKFAAVNYSPSATSGSFFFAPVQLTAGTSYLATIYYRTDSASWTTASLKYGTAATEAALTNTIASQSNAVASSGYLPLSGYFTPSVTGTYYIAFQAYNADTTPNYIAIDDFSLSLTPSCIAPTNLAVTTNPATLSANISWTGPPAGVTGTATGYEYAVTTSSTPPASGTVASGTSVNNVPLAATNTTYYLHVRANCDASGYSAWTTSASFVSPQITAVTSGDFSTASNWNNGTGPACGQQAVIPSGITMSVSSGTASTGSLTIQSGGTLNVSGGSFTVGCTGNNNTLLNAGTLNISGGNLAVNGNIANSSGSTFIQSAGSIVVDGNNNNTPASSVASGTPLVAFGTSSTAFSTGTITLSGGTLTIVDPHTATTNTNAYALYGNLGVNFNASTSHTLQFGDGVSTQAGGNTSGFYYNLAAGSGRLNLGNVIVNNPGAVASRIVTQTGANTINGNFTITAGTYSQGSATTNIGGNITVENGAMFITGGTTVFGTTTGSGSATAQTITQSVTVNGTGTIQNAATSPDGNFQSVTFRNTSATGVTINPLNQVIANSSIAACIRGSITFDGKVSTTGGRSLHWGTAANLGSGSITVTSGGMMPGSAFSRGWNASSNTNGSGSTISAGSAPSTTDSEYPLIDENGNARYAWIQRSGGSASGILAVTYTAAAGTNTVSIADGAYTVDTQSKGKWTVSALGTTIAGTSYNFAVSAPSVFGAILANANARIVTLSGVTGTHQAGTTLPHAQRTGLTLAQLTGQDFYIGVNNVDVPFYSVQTGNWNTASTWSKNAVPSSADAVTISSGHTVTVDGSYTAVANSLTVNATGVIAVNANSLTIGTSVSNSGTINAGGGTIAVTGTLTNNAAATVNATAGAINVTGAATTGISNSGTFVLNGATVNVGVTNNTFCNRSFTNPGTLTATSGSLNIYGNLSNSGTLSQSGGTIKIDGNAGGVAANSVASGTPLFSCTSTAISLTGGTLLFVDPHTATTNTNGYALYFSNGTASTTSLGASPSHITRFGDGVSTDAGGHTSGFYVDTWESTAFICFGSVEVNGGSGTNRNTNSYYNFAANGDVTVKASSTFTASRFLLGRNLNIETGGTFINAEVFSASIVTSNDGSNLTLSNTPNAQAITINGTLANAASSPTANTTAFNVRNSNSAGLTLNSPLSVSGTLALNNGVVHTTSINLLSLGTATAAGTLTGGSATTYIDGPMARTFAAGTTATGTYDGTTMLPVGKGATFLPVFINPTVAASGAVIFRGEAFTSNSGTMGTGVTSLSANRWEVIPVTGGANLTNAFVRLGDAGIVSSNKIVHSSSANGVYSPILPATAFATGTLTSATAIVGTDYLGYFAYGDLNPCTAPTDQPSNFVVASKTDTSVIAGFTAAASAPSHYLVVRYPSGGTVTPPADYTNYAANAALGAGIVTYSGTALTFTQAGLTPSTAYDFYVYSYNNSGCYGPLYNAASPLAYTLTTCGSSIGKPGNPSSVAAQLTDHSFRAQWTTSSTTGVSYVIDVATDNLFTAFVTGYQGLNVGTALQADVTGLTQGTTYYVRVRAQNGTDCSSQYANTLVVTTEGLMPTPWLEPFVATTAPTGWNTNSEWYFNPAYFTGNTGNAIFINLYDDWDSSVTEGTFTTTNVGPVQANQVLTFDYKLDNYDDDNAPAADSGQFTISISTDFGQHYTEIQTVVNDGVAGWRDMMIDLSAYVGSNIKIKVYAEYDSGDYYLGFDNFKVDAAPACVKPSNATALIANAGMVNLQWNAPVIGAAPAGYQYAVTTSASDPVQGVDTILDATAASVTDYAISHDVMYYLHVRSSCGDSNYSEWIKSAPFKYLSGDFCTDAINLATLTSPYTGTTLGATDNFSSPCASGNTSPDLFYYISVPNGYKLTIGQTENGYDSEDYIGYGGGCPGSDTQIACYDDSDTTQTTWTNTTGSAQTVYYVQDGYYDGEDAGSFTLAWSLTPPAITSFSPLAMCAGNTTTVTITGVNFVNVSFVKFNGVDVPYTVDSATSITATVPGTTTTGPITIGVYGGTVTNATNFTVNPYPVVADITGGDISACMPDTVQLSNSTSGGTWTSSNTNIATVSSTGLVTPVTAGAVTITYSKTTNGCETSKTTNVTFNQPVNITVMPTSETVLPDSGVQFSVTATGTGLTYQWEVSSNGGTNYTAIMDDAVYVGATTGTLSISDVTGLDGYRYRAVVSGSSPCTPVTSGFAVLTISDIGITSHPSNVILCDSGTGMASFSVATTGDNLNFEWQQDTGTGTWLPLANGTADGVTYSGADTNTLSLSGLTAANNGWRYRAFVSDGVPNATSNPATLTVNQAPTVITQPSAGIVCSTGGTTQFTVGATGTGLTYQWQYATSANGSYSNVTNATPAGATYSNATSATMSVTTTTATPSSATYYYRVVISGTSPCTATTSNPATLDINAPAITSAPAAASVVKMNSTTFSVATSAPAPTYQWQFATTSGGTYSNVADNTPAGTTYSGAQSSTLTVNATSTATGSGYYYRVIVTSGGCTVTSAGAQMTVTDYCVGIVNNTSTTDIMTAVSLATTTLNSTPGLVGTLSNNYYALLTGSNNTATLLQAQTYTASITVGSGNTQGAGIWIDFNNDGDFSDSNEFLGTASIASGGTGTISVTIPGNVSLGNRRMRVRNGRNQTSMTSTSVCATFGRGTTVDYIVTIAQPAAPSISGFTQSATCADTATLTINGTNLTGGALSIGGTAITTPAPVVNSAGTQMTATVNAGISGTVSVTTPGGTATSPGFSLSAPAPFTISSSGATICEGESTGTVTVTAGSSDYNTYVVTSVPANAAYSGNAASGYTFSPSANTVYTISASQSSGSCTRTAAFTVTVKSNPSYPVSPSSAAICSGEIQMLTAGLASPGGTATLGTGTSVAGSSDTDKPNPLSAYYGGQKAQMLFRASELTAQNLHTGSKITAVTFNLGAFAASACTNFTIRMGLTTATELSSFASGTTTVYGPATYTPSGTGLVTFTLATPFIWDGTSNIIVETVHNAGNGGNGSGSNTVYTTTSFNSTYFRMQDNVSGGIAGFDAATAGITAVSKARPNMTFVFSNPVPVWTPVTGLYTDAAATVPYVANAQRTTVYAKPSVTTTYTATMNNGTCTSDSEAVITINPKSWIGTAGADWNDPANWCGGQVPTAEDDIVISDVTTQPEISGNMTAVGRNLTVEEGASMVVEGGNVLNITNAVTVEEGASLVLENYAHLLQGAGVTTNPNSGSIEVYRVSSPIYRLDYTMWSSPVEGQMLKDFSPETLDNRFYTYNETNDMYSTVTDPLTTEMEEGVGYLIRAANNHPEYDETTNASGTAWQGQFEGKPRSGNVDVSMSTEFHGFNAVGNPYPSPINIHAFYDANEGIIADGSALYFWRKKNDANTSSYAKVTKLAYTRNQGNDWGDTGGTAFNGSPSTWVINPGQGFIVKATGSMLHFNNSMRVGLNNQQFFRTAQDEDEATISRMWLNLTGTEDKFSQTAIGYTNMTTMAIDYGWDGKAFVNDGNVSLFSLVDEETLGIQARSAFNPDDVVPLGYRAETPGTYTIALDHMDGVFSGDQDIFIKDNLLGGVTHNLKISDYTFETEAGTFNSRFEVVYAEVLGTDNPVLDPNNVIVYKQGTDININAGILEMTEVTIYDTRGRILYSKDGINATETVINNLHSDQQVLIIQINTLQGRVTKRIIY